ncbi:hypothetical protein L7F22_009126 [Adiantum nelumboides]|nr:hypothetical protein [Adiantum nelumboides]
MAMIRIWFKSGAYGEGNNEFAHINLRSNRDEANQLQNYIDAHMYMLEPLHFGETTISWDSKDVYAKVLEWRHYKRRSKSSGTVSSINPKPAQSMIKLDVTSLENQSHVNSQVDVRRRQLYAPIEMCSICNNNLGYHIDLFGTTYDLPPQVVAWRYSMQQGITKEYIEAPLLDKEVINFGIGTFIRSVNMHHYEIWMVQLSSLKASKFGCIYVPGSEGKSIEDLSPGDIIEVPSVYAKRVECTILSPKIDKEKESMEALNGGNGYRTFMNLMKDAIHERKHHEDIGAQVEATKVYERDLQHSISFNDLDVESFENMFHGKKTTKALEKAHEYSENTSLYRRAESIHVPCYEKHDLSKGQDNDKNLTPMECIGEMNAKMNEETLTSEWDNEHVYKPILADQSLSNEVSDNDVEEEIIGIVEHEIKLGNLKIKISAPNSPKDLEENSIVSLLNMEVEEMESIALQAMGLHDVDEMYGSLESIIKGLKDEYMNFFVECISKSDPLYLLRCYATWATYSKNEK